MGSETKETGMIQPNGLCGLVRVTVGTCTRTGLGMIKDFCLFFMPDDGFMVMQENVFIFQKSIFMCLGKTSCF